MTANAMVGDRDSALAAGMNDHIAKPIVVDQMFATLAKWVKPTRSVAADDDHPRTDTVLNLKGIDTHCGLANTGGNAVLYRRMLGLFVQREADFAKRSHAARAAGDADAAMRAAHDLKAEAGTLGMHAVQETAAALERGYLESACDADVDGMVRSVSSVLDEVLDELRALETRTPADRGVG